jgi:hypothetical protein
MTSPNSKLRKASLSNVPYDTLLLIIFTITDLALATLKFKKSLD